MRSMERSHSRGVDQAHIADDRRGIETRKHSDGTTWNDLIQVPFKGNRGDGLVNSKKMSGNIETFKSLIDSLLVDEDDENTQDTAIVETKQQEQEALVADAHKQEKTKEETVEEVRNIVLESFRKTENPIRSQDEALAEEAAETEEEVKEVPVVKSEVEPVEKREYREEKAEKVLGVDETLAEPPTAEGEIETPNENSEKQPKNIDSNVFRALFGVPTNIRNMLGDQQFSKWQNIVNQDISDGKYRDARYEDGLVYYVGDVNDGSIDDRGDDWDIMKYRSRDERLKYNEQVKSIDPKVWEQINKTVYALGMTLGDNSKEYHDALNKINQDIYDGRYKAAEYVAVRDEGGEHEEGVIVFDETVVEEGGREALIEESGVAEPEDEVMPDAEMSESERVEPSRGETFEGEMAGIIGLEVRKGVDMLKKIYASLNNATDEQRDRFRYLYDNLSVASKIIPSNRDEEQRKLDQVLAYENLINELYRELNGE